MVLTGRLKLLVAAAAAVALYVVMSTPKDPAEPAPATAGAASRAAAGSTGAAAQSAANRAAGRNVSSAGSEDAARMLAQLSNRVTDDQSAGALFKAQLAKLGPMIQGGTATPQAQVALGGLPSRDDAPDVLGRIYQEPNPPVSSCRAAITSTSPAATAWPRTTA